MKKNEGMCMIHLISTNYTCVCLFFHRNIFKDISIHYVGIYISKCK